MKRNSSCLVAAAVAALLPFAASASSHREAPFITEMPKVDGTDFYMFNSYEPGREGYVTIVANYVPLQAPYGGPNYFSLDPDAKYEIHIDNDGGLLALAQRLDCLRRDDDTSRTVRGSGKGCFEGLLGHSPNLNPSHGEEAVRR